MKQLTIQKTPLNVSEIALGCMRINALDKQAAEGLIRGAMEQGINFFDHADIYGGGEAERFFAEAVGMHASLREQMIIQSKASIRNGMYDASKEWLITSVEGILSRLQTDYLDTFLIHRPDALMEPEEVAEAFRILKAQGKVRHFGVSNANPYQIALLNQYCDEPMVINQLQMSIAECSTIDAGLHVNTQSPQAINRDGSVLDYCRLHGIQVQAWSPFQHGLIAGVFLDNPDYPEINRVIDELAAKYNVTNSAIATAWLLRHPAKIQTIVGTTNSERLRNICKASTITLTREEWYRLYCAAGKQLP